MSLPHEIPYRPVEAPFPYPPVSMVLLTSLSPGEGELLRFAVAQRQTGLEAGAVTFPGGKVEIGETPEQAAFWELLEETELLSPAGYPKPLRSWVDHMTTSGGQRIKAHVFTVPVEIFGGQMPVDCDPKLGPWDFKTIHQIEMSTKDGRTGVAFEILKRHILSARGMWEKCLLYGLGYGHVVEENEWRRRERRRNRGILSPS